MKKYRLYIVLLLVFGIWRFAIAPNMWWNTEPVPPVTAVRTALPKEPVRELEVSDIDKSVLVEETNAYRKSKGLEPLIHDPRLDVSARDKCEDMVKRDYWQHQTPDGEQPWKFMLDNGISYRSAGENQAYGMDNAVSYVSSWVDSPTHRENITGDFTHVGFGVCKSDNFVNLGYKVIVVQHFIAI